LNGIRVLAVEIVDIVFDIRLLIIRLFV